MQLSATKPNVVWRIWHININSNGAGPNTWLQRSKSFLALPETTPGFKQHVL